jgi:hypothetical protein
MTRKATLFALIFVLSSALPTAAGIVTIDFDDFTPAVYSTDFLAAYGIPDMIIGGTGPGAAGPRVLDFTGHTAPSAPNILLQHSTSNDYGQTQSLTFLFSPELTEFSLTRAGTTVSSTPAWSATFMDSSDAVLGSFGEPTWLNVPPPKQFTFTAPAGHTIAKMKLQSVWTVSTWRNVPVDDFILTQVVPEPSTLAMLCLLAVIGTFGMRRLH